MISKFRLASFVFAMSTLASASHAFSAPIQVGNWGSFSKYGCYDSEHAKYAAVLWDIPWGVDWEESCASRTAVVNGQFFDHPTACRNHDNHMWGEFKVVEECH